MKQITALFLILVASQFASAKPKPAVRVYDARCAKVWPVAKSVVKDHYDVLNLNDQERSGSFTTGSVWSGVRPLTFSLTGEGDSCEVAVTGHFAGLIHSDKGDFFQRIKEAGKFQMVKDGKLPPKEENRTTFLNK